MQRIKAEMTCNSRANEKIPARYLLSLPHHLAGCRVNEVNTPAGRQRGAVLARLGV
jgi:hypothetical protein